MTIGLGKYLIKELEKVANFLSVTKTELIRAALLEYLTKMKEVHKIK